MSGDARREARRALGGGMHFDDMACIEDLIETLGKRLVVVEADHEELEGQLRRSRSGAQTMDEALAEVDGERMGRLEALCKRLEHRVAQERPAVTMAANQPPYRVVMSSDDSIRVTLRGEEIDLRLPCKDDESEGKSESDGERSDVHWGMMVITLASVVSAGLGAAAAWWLI